MLQFNNALEYFHVDCFHETLPCSKAGSGTDPAPVCLTGTKRRSRYFSFAVNTIGCIESVKFGQSV
jgi:hypothetical protein